MRTALLVTEMCFLQFYPPYKRGCLVLLLVKISPVKTKSAYFFYLTLWSLIVHATLLRSERT